MRLQNLEIILGDSAQLTGHAFQNDAAMNLAGCTVYLTCKYHAGDPIGQAVFQKSSPSSGIVISDAATGTFVVAIASSDLSAITSTPQVLVYDVKIKTGSGYVSTVTSGTLTVMPSVTGVIA